MGRRIETFSNYAFNVEIQMQCVGTKRNEKKEIRSYADEHYGKRNEKLAIG